MFRLWKGRKDAENKTNNLNEKNTHEIKSQIENDGTNGTDLDKPGSHLIDLRHIFKIYYLGGEEVRANDDVSVAIDKGEFVAIVGKSGSGKSTLMNILGCMDRQFSGTYELDGISIAQQSENQLSAIRNQKIGFVFQAFQLIPRTSALKNVEIPMIYAGMKADARKAKAAALLEKVGLGQRIHHMPNELSGGQKQRVAIARALANDPAIILADEPTGNLDTKASYEIMEFFTNLNKEGATVVVVTHEEEIAAYTDRIIRFQDGQIISDKKVVKGSC